MKIAFACWEDRIAPVFDTARQISLVQVASGKIIFQAEHALFDELPLQRACRLVELGIHTLICGAISQSLQVLVVSHGVAVIPFVAGNLEEVVRAWLDGNLISDRFIMPGCCGRGLRGHVARGAVQSCQGGEAACAFGPESGEHVPHGGAGRRRGRGREDSN